MNSSSDSQSSLRRRVSVAESVDKICDEFEARLRSGEYVAIESIVDQLEEPARTNVLREALALELEHRLHEGQTPKPGEYHHRFPDDRGLIDKVFAEVEKAWRTERYEIPETAKLDEKFGRFELRQIVGQGAFATVFQAYDPQLDRDIALKIPKQAVTGEPTEVARVLREARAAAQLRHPNIVAVHDAGEIDGTLFIATDFIKGKTLRECLEEGRDFTILETVTLLRKLALALQAAHEKGVIHRDIKPGNVILDESGEPHITDFGLARRETGDELETTEGTVLGTPSYMSPEQAAGDSRRASAASDIWALGVIMFELLTGRRPFFGSSEDVLHDVQHGVVPCLSDLKPSIPLGLDSICLRCLAKDPAKRYGSCQKLADDLEPWSEHVSAQSKTRLRKAISRPFRRWPLLSAVSIMAAVLLAAAVAVPRIISSDSSEQTKGTRSAPPANRADRQRPEDRQERSQKRDRILRLEQDHNVSAHPLRTVAFSPKGFELVTAGEDRAIVKWDKDGKEKWRVREAHGGDIWCVAFDPSGELLASASEDGTVKLWEVATGENVGVHEHAGQVWCVAFSPKDADTVTLASASSDRSVKVWSVDKDTPLRSLELGNSVWSVAYSRDGSMLACGDVLGGISLWDTAEGQKLGETTAHQKAVSAIAFAPESSHLVSAGQDGDVKLWTVDRNTGEITLEQVAHHHEFGANHVSYSPDGGLIASVGSDEKLYLWDVEAKKAVLEVEAHRNKVFCVAFNRQGDLLATAGGEGAVKLWEVSKDALIQKTVLIHAERRPRLHRDFANAIVLEVESPNRATVRDATTSPPYHDIYRFVATDPGFVEFRARIKSDVIATMRFHDDDLDREPTGIPNGVNGHESSPERRTCWVRHEVRANGVYFVRIFAKDERKSLRYDLEIRPISNAKGI